MNNWDDIEEFFDDEWCDVAEFKNKEYKVIPFEEEKGNKAVVAGDADTLNIQLMFVISHFSTQPKVGEIIKFDDQDYRVASTKKDETRKGLIVTLQDKYAT